MQTRSTSKFWLAIAAGQAVVALLGSLFFSQVMHFNPCELCWLQRICMYPMALILPIALFTKDRSVFLRYVTPLILIGLSIALYHNLIYYISIYQQLHPSAVITTCVTSGPNSCTTRFISWFGFITIPLLSFTAFSVIGCSLLRYSQLIRRES